MNDTLANGTNSSVPWDMAPETAMNSIKLILGLPVNGYVVWLILSGAGGTIASEFFYLNLIVSVIIASLASCLYFVWLFTRNSLLISIIGIVYVGLFWYPVPLFQCCVCVERYIAVVHPVVFLRYKALQYRVACCCAVWLVALAFTACLMIFNSSYIPYYFLVVFWAVCICVVCFCCFSVLRALKQPGPGEGQRDSSGEGNNTKRRACRTILISLVGMSLTVFSYIPIFLVYLLKLLEYETGSRMIIVTITTTLMFVHPLLYLHKAGKLPCFK